MHLIYHVVRKVDWMAYDSQPMYAAASLQSEGFIHFSTKGQVAGVLKRYYTGQSNLLLIHVDADQLTHDLRYDVSTDNERFPHLYGPLNKRAVVRIEPLA